MRQVLKAILASKKIFSMLFIGFLLTILPILVALSTQRYYDEHFYHSKNGHFQNYYSVTLKNAEEADLSDIQNKAKAFFKEASVLTDDMTLVRPKVGQVAVVGLVGPGDWTPPLVEGTSMDSNKSNEIAVGRLVSDHIGPLNIEDKTYQVMGIAGEDRGEELINVYNFKIYMDIKDLPDSIKKEMEKQHLLRFIVRSDADPAAEIERFIAAITDIDPGVQAAVVNENENYQREKNTRQGVNEVIGYPYKLFLIALINCVNISYLWIYLKRKEISLRKALGASSFQLFIYMTSQLLVCSLLAVLCSMLVQWALSRASLNILNVTSYYVHLSLIDFAIGTLITFAAAIVTVILPFLHVLKIEPAKALKE